MKSQDIGRGVKWGGALVIFLALVLTLTACGGVTRDEFARAYNIQCREEQEDLSAFRRADQETRDRYDWDMDYSYAEYASDSHDQDVRYLKQQRLADQSRARIEAPLEFQDDFEKENRKVRSLTNEWASITELSRKLAATARYTSGPELQQAISAYNAANRVYDRHANETYPVSAEYARFSERRLKACGETKWVR